MSPARDLQRWLRETAWRAATVTTQLLDLLRRLNHAGLPPGARLPVARDERIRFVKDVLAERHQGHNHCC
jgi:hypothetical protein